MKLTSSRRLFLTGAGGAALALPFLPSLLPRAVRSAAKAEAPEIPRRFIAMKTYNGMPVQDWYPHVAPSGYGTHRDGSVALSQTLPEATGRHTDGGMYSGRWAPLADFASSGVSNILSRALNPFLDSMLLFRGLDFMPGLNHNYGGYLGNLGLNTNGTGGAVTGAQINATMDHVMAASRCVYPSTPAGPRILHVGSRRNASSYAPRSSDVLAIGEDSIEQAQSFINPRAAFQATFGSFMGEAGDEPGLSARLVDRVLEDYRRAMGGPNIGAEDRITLQRHIDHLADLEARVNTMHMNQCELSMPDDVDTGGEFSVDAAGVTALFENMVDLVALALSCDATRVVTLDVTKMVASDGGDTFGIGDSENPNNAGRSNWHLLAHEWSDNAQRWLGQGAQWVAETVVARLLARLQEVTETDGESLLHHSMLLWSNELSFNHLNYSMPTVMWGRAGGILKTGRYLDYVDHDRNVRFSQHGGNVIEGVQYNRLLVTIMQAMGMSPAEYEREAGRGFGEYRTINKGDGFARDYDESNVGQPLPDIFV